MLRFANCIIFYLFIYFHVSAAQDIDSKVYGSDWVLFPDDRGRLHYANVTAFMNNFFSIIDYVERHVYFHLYTSGNKEEYELLTIPEDKNERIDYEYLQPDKEYKFVTHGWMSSGNSSTVINIKDAYLSENNYNVIIVDWHEIADEMVYMIASTSTRYVGLKVSEMIINLMTNYNASGYRMHLVGHSLGAHVMGYAARYTRRDHNETISRVTGLDPARPMFELPPTDGLISTDAEFVDIIHTCARVLGYYTVYGDADFYPNNGLPPQPGCDGIFELIDACSHARAHQYFVESINTRTGFYSYPCDSYNDFTDGKCKSNSTLMGEHVDHNARGVYYLNTNAAETYARGREYEDDE